MKKLKVIFFSLALSFVLSLALTAAAAMIVSKLGVLPQRSLAVMTTLLCCVSVMLGGYTASLILKERGILLGAMVAAAYVAVLIVVSFFAAPIVPQVSELGKAAAILLSGAIGGILAVNRKVKLKF